MRTLVFTNMYPSAAMPFYGSFVRDEADALREAGVDVDVYFVNGRANKLNYFGMPAGFFERIRRTPYDVVHVHHSFCGLVATMQKKIPVVWTFHEGEISGDTADALREQPIKHIAYSKKMKRYVAQKVDAVVVVAEHLREPLGRADALWLPAGINWKRFAPMDSGEAKRQLGLSLEKRYVLFPAAPARVEKRYDLARSGFERFLESTPAAHDLELIALDNVPHERVPLYMNASEVVLMTSAFEASPVTVREALACNVPVICTDVGDARVVMKGIAGCHIVAAEPKAIATALRDTLNGPRRVESRERMHAYALDTVAQKLIALYGEVIQKHSQTYRRGRP
ncbi:MAG TPA: glycosyltransferase family 4 protein [Candidatus Krumholzibacteria bacterium]|nr:glycosyltransferase family 4 protein [Candidatus Krumholzibacteria bacterium]